MSGRKESDGYLPPNEQLLITSKVNRLCEATPDTFDSDVHVPLARDLVHALDPRIKLTKGRSFKATIFSSTESEELAGATDIGNVSTGVDTEETTTYELNVQEYRIGGYIATKRAKGGISSMRFTPFWDRDWEGELVKYSNRTSLEYMQSDLDLLKIAVITPQVAWQIAFIVRVKDHEIPLWEKDKHP